jgi:PAS domain S-box-containing protein
VELSAALPMKPDARIPLAYELAVNQVTEHAIFMMDPEGRAASWNPGVQQVLGWSEQEWLGQPAEVIFPNNDRAAALAELETAKREGQASDDRWMMRRDGTLFFANGVSTCIHRGRRHVGFLKVLRDRTADHERARQLDEEHARLRLALQAAHAVAWEWDSKRDILRHGGDEQSLVGPSPVTLEEFLQRVAPEDRSRVSTAMRAAIAQKSQFSAEFRLLPMTDKDFWLSAKGQVQEQDTSRIVGVLADITAQRETEKALRIADQRKDEFLATLAHELRNPLAPLRTGLQIMRLAREDPGKLDRARELMERQLGYVIHLIDDLMDITRITHGKLNLRTQVIAVGAVVESAVEMARPMIDAEGHTLTVELPQNILWVNGDPVRLAQILTNLLINAAKYTEPGGRINLQADFDNKGVAIRVSDNGIGLSADALDEVFEMFTQSRTLLRAPQGLGIGLALARALVRMHGGHISAASPGPGKGSTFTVTLPLADHGGEARSPAPADEMLRTTTPRRILIADDNLDAAEALALLLRMSGDEVCTAKDGLEALQQATDFHPDVVLLDIGMPRMDGLEAARRLRQQPWAKKVLILAMTGWGQESDRQRSKEAGIDYHLVKPVDPLALRHLLTNGATGAGMP